MSSNNANSIAISSFNSNHSSYDQLRPSFNEKVVDSFLIDLELMEDGKYLTDKKILEIASGTGKFTRSLTNRGWNSQCLKVLEPSSGMIKTFKKNFPDIEAIEGSSYKIPLDDNSVDAIIVAQGFHWFSDIESLKEIRRVLKKNCLFGSIWNYDCPSKAQNLLTIDTPVKYIFEGPHKEEFEQQVKNGPKSLTQPSEISFKYFEQTPWAKEVAQYVYSFDVNVPQYRHSKWRELLNTPERSDLFYDIEKENFLLTLTSTPLDDVFKLWQTRSYITVLPESKQLEIKNHIETLIKEKVREQDKICIDDKTLLKKALGTHSVVLRAKK